MSHEAQRILRSVPEFAIIRHDLALSLLHQGRDEEALAVLAAAPDERVSTIGGLVNRSLKLAVEGRSAEAVALLRDDLVRGSRRRGVLGVVGE